MKVINYLTSFPGENMFVHLGIALLFFTLGVSGENGGYKTSKTTPFHTIYAQQYYYNDLIGTCLFILHAPFPLGQF